jgi:hypothetical protein
MKPCVRRKISAPAPRAPGGDGTNRDSSEAATQTRGKRFVVRRFSALAAAPCAEAHDYEHVNERERPKLTQSRLVRDFKKPGAAGLGVCTSGVGVVDDGGNVFRVAGKSILVGRRKP